MARQPYIPTARDAIKSRQVDRPEPGVWLIRVYKDGPLVPAAIFYPCPWIEPGRNVSDAHPNDWGRPADRSRHLRGMVNGLPADPVRIWTSRNDQSDTMDYQVRVAIADWARIYDPESPEANPYKPIIKPIADAPPERRQAVALASHPTLF